MPRADVERAGFPMSGALSQPLGMTRRWQRRLLVAVLVATILAGFGMILLAQTQSAPRHQPAGAASRLVENRTMAELGNIPGFQRRGNSVIGEVCTRDGQVLRLVLDARHQALLGFRLVEGKADAPSACMPQSTLPIAQTPAN